MLIQSDNIIRVPRVYPVAKPAGAPFVVNSTHALLVRNPTQQDREITIKFRLWIPQPPWQDPLETVAVLGPAILEANTFWSWGMANDEPYEVQLDVPVGLLTSNNANAQTEVYGSTHDISKVGSAPITIGQPLTHLNLDGIEYERAKPPKALTDQQLIEIVTKKRAADKHQKR